MRKLFSILLGVLVLLAHVGAPAQAQTAQCNSLWQRGQQQEFVVNDRVSIWEQAMDAYFEALGRSFEDLQRYLDEQETIATRREIRSRLLALAEYSIDMAEQIDRVTDPVESQLETLRRIRRQCPHLFNAYRDWHESKTDALEIMLDAFRDLESELRADARMLASFEQNPARLMRRLEMVRMSQDRW